MIIYDPEKMWFDYQALFDKTRNRILGLNDNIKVKHTDFKENYLARLVIFIRSKTFLSQHRIWIVRNN